MTQPEVEHILILHQGVKTPSKGGTAPAQTPCWARRSPKAIIKDREMLQCLALMMPVSPTPPLEIPCSVNLSCTISSSLRNQSADSPAATVYAVHAAYMRYKILDVPPWYECILLGFQVRNEAIPEVPGLSKPPDLHGSYAVSPISYCKTHTHTYMQPCWLNHWNETLRCAVCCAALSDHVGIHSSHSIPDCATHGR